jgi:hypothetical protein
LRSADYDFNWVLQQLAVLASHLATLGAGFAARRRRDLESYGSRYGSDAGHSSAPPEVERPWCGALVGLDGPLS